MLTLDYRKQPAKISVGQWPPNTSVVPIGIKINKNGNYIMDIILSRFAPDCGTDVYNYLERRG